MPLTSGFFTRRSISVFAPEETVPLTVTVLLSPDTRVTSEISAADDRTNDIVSGNPPYAAKAMFAGAALRISWSIRNMQIFFILS